MRDVAERHVGEPLDHVRVDASAEGHREAQAHSALAVTSGSRISFDEDTSLLDGGVASRFVLAHELTHAAQQRRAGRVASQRVPNTVEEEGFEEASKTESGMSKYLAAKGKDEKKVDEVLKNTDPSKAKRSEVVFEIERKIRLRALSLMAAHRSRVLSTRNQMLAQLEAEAKAAGAPPGSAAAERPKKGESVLGTVRRAVEIVEGLRQKKEQLEEARSELGLAKSFAIQGRDLLGVVRTLTTQADVPASYKSAVAAYFRAYLHDGARAQLASAAMLLAKLRTTQLAGVTTGLSVMYQRFPMLNALDFAKARAGYTAPAPGVSPPTPPPPQGPPGKAPSGAPGETDADRQLHEEIRAAYAKTAQRITTAIGYIARGEISAFDMPAPVAAARAELKPELVEILNEEVTSREHEKFWLNIGLTIADTVAGAIFVFNPVIGGLLVAAASAATVGTGIVDLKNLLAADAVAGATTDPYGKSPLGVDAPGTFELAMVSLQIILGAMEGASIFKTLRAGRVSKELGSLLDETEELRLAGKNDELAEVVDEGTREVRMKRSGRLPNTEISDEEALRELADLASGGRVRGPEGARYAYSEDGAHWMETGPNKWCRSASPTKCIEWTLEKQLIEGTPHANLADEMADTVKEQWEALGKLPPDRAEQLAPHLMRLEASVGKVSDDKFAELVGAWLDKLQRARRAADEGIDFLAKRKPGTASKLELAELPKDAQTKANKLLRERNKARAERDAMIKRGASADELKDVYTRIAGKSEELGLLGADQAIQKQFPGPPPPRQVYPPPGVKDAARPGEFDRVYEVHDKSAGTRLVVVEAKGGVSPELGSRRVAKGVAQQGSKEYLKDIIAQMKKSPDPKIRAVAQRLDDMNTTEQLAYFEAKFNVSPSGGAKGIKLEEFDIYD
ncbi:MAG: DUF4157 domain-containing protein [Myxococcales bacterium]|nr:DUF4157 domain-containing protein [Myxococcales bacterium]MCB9580300.1 DUF4157 domain-containing protein [Polyangiaceae bacterium]